MENPRDSLGNKHEELIRIFLERLVLTSVDGGLRRAVEYLYESREKLQSENSRLREALDLASSMCGIPDARDACYKINRLCQKALSQETEASKEK